MIITVTGPSGVGKTTLTNALLENLPNAVRLVSVTTRPARPTDPPGEYEQVSQEEFEQLERAGAFLKPFSAHGFRFGTRKKDILNALTNGTFIAVLVIEAVELFRTIAKEHGHEQELVCLYLHLDDEEELRRRLGERGDTVDAEIERRIVECRSWSERARTSDAGFVYLDASASKKEVIEQALRYIKK